MHIWQHLSRYHKNIIFSRGSKYVIYSHKRLLRGVNFEFSKLFNSHLRNIAHLLPDPRKNQSQSILMPRVMNVANIYAIEISTNKFTIISAKGNQQKSLFITENKSKMTFNIYVETNKMPNLVDCYQWEHVHTTRTRFTFIAFMERELIVLVTYW